MPSLRMTPTRIELLRAVKAGKVKVDVLASDRHAFRTDRSGYPTVTHALHLLRGDRLVSWPERKPGDARTVVAETTKRGDDALDAWDPGYTGAGQ